MSLAFEGIRVLDFTQLMAGPFATCQMALFGADVIKVEKRGAGDQFAHAMQTDAARASGRAFPFQAINHNKRSLSIDLQQPEGIAVIRQIAKSCDVLVENFAAGAIGRLGLGYEDIVKVNPEIVYCSVSGYGQTGPKAGKPAFDAAIQGASGMMSITGSPESGPMRTGYQTVDIPTAMMAAFAMTAGLLRKFRTGKGQYIDVAMMDTAVLMQVPQFMNYLNAGEVPELLGNRSISNNPTSDAFKASDGYILMTTLKEKHVEAVFNATGQSQAYADPRFSTDAQRKLNADAVRALLAPGFASRTADHWVEVLGAQGVGIGKVTKIPEVVQDPQFEHRAVFAKVPMAGAPQQQITSLGTSIVTSTEAIDVSAAPTLGQHTEEILAEFGYDAAAIAQLRAKSVI